MSRRDREPRESQDGWIRSILKEGPAWIIALTGVVGLGIGTGAGYGASKAQTSGPRPTVTVTVTRPNPQESTPQPTTDGAQAVRNSGSLTLNFNESADLDSKQSNWDAPNPSQGADITNYEGFDATNSGASLARLGDLPATYRGCMATSDYIPVAQGLPLDQVSQGMNFCVKTDRGRFSLLHVTKVVSDPNKPDYIAFKVTTWEHSTNQ